MENVYVDSFYIYPDDALSSVYSYSGLAKDNKHLYYLGKAVPQIDPHSVEFIAEKNGKVSGDFIKAIVHMLAIFNKIARYFTIFLGYKLYAVRINLRNCFAEVI